MIDDSKKVLFILGCERSGSTWVSNIIDSHPDVEFFMEPFADYANMFPGFPERNYYLSDANKYLISLVRDRYSQLFHLKYLLNKRGGKPFFSNLDKFVVNCYNLISRLIRVRYPVKVDQFTSLNLNRKVSYPFRKNKEIQLVAMKELRLNFKVGLLSTVFPNARFLIIIRNPGAEISSIIRLMNQGHLGELKKSLISLPEFIYGISRFEKYRLLFDKDDWGQSIEDMLIAWWIVNYDVLIEDCKKYNVNYKIMYHEDISEDPDVKSKDIFKFVGLEPTSEVKKYVNESSHDQHKIKSAVDTSRNSVDYYKKQIANISPLLLSKLSKVFKSIDIGGELKEYEDKF